MNQSRDNYRIDNLIEWVTAELDYKSRTLFVFSPYMSVVVKLQDLEIGSKDIQIDIKFKIIKVCPMQQSGSAGCDMRDYFTNYERHELKLLGTLTTMK